jgi:hypothetical protein
MQGFPAEPAVAADGAGRTAFRGVPSLHPAPLLNSAVRRRALRWVGGSRWPMR